jgi:hypothetical protein
MTKEKRGGEIVGSRPLASVLLTGQRQNATEDLSFSGQLCSEEYFPARSKLALPASSRMI